MFHPDDTDSLRTFLHHLATGDTAPGRGDPSAACRARLWEYVPGDPWGALAAAWWVGVYASRVAEKHADDIWWIADPFTATLLARTVQACTDIGRPAAHAAIPFVLFVRARYGEFLRDPFNALTTAAQRTLEAVEKLDADARRASRVTDFLALAERHRHA